MGSIASSELPPARGPATCSVLGESSTQQRCPAWGWPGEMAAGSLHPLGHMDNSHIGPTAPHPPGTIQWTVPLSVSLECLLGCFFWPVTWAELSPTQCLNTDLKFRCLSELHRNFFPC